MNSSHTTAGIAAGIIHSQDAASASWLSSFRSMSWSTIFITAFAGYVLLCAALRFRFEKSMLRRFHYPDRASLAHMTEEDAQAVLKYIGTYEFPFMYTLALQFGIFKTYGFATISQLIVATRALVDPLKAGKRYEDTTIIFMEFSLNPPKSDRCLKAIARMNYLHSSYKAAGKIKNEDFLYTLSVCVTEPIRFMRLFEWRPLNDMERNAIGVFWKSVGDAMSIEYAGCLEHGEKRDWRDGLDFVDDITKWAAKYECEAMLPDPINMLPSRRLTDLLLNYAPKFTHAFITELLTALMSSRMRDAFLYPEPSIVARAVAYNGLIIRRFILRHLTLPRLSAIQYTSEPDPVTGRIHHNEYLVEPWYNKATFWSRWGPKALVLRAIGGIVPDSNNNSYLAEGFLAEDLGPQSKMGKGVEQMEADVTRLRKERMSGCPFG